MWKPLETAGIYVPGGTASYPSTVLMNAIPAMVAGVKDIVMATPLTDGQINPSVLYAAKIVGIKNDNPAMTNIQAFEVFMTTKDYDLISSGEFHNKWVFRIEKK